MNTRMLDSAPRRVAIGVAVLTGIILIAAAIYTFVGPALLQPANGLKIVAAAHAYTRVLRAQKKDVPATVPLQTLVDLGFLKPADIGSLQGTEATLTLTAPTNGGANLVLLRAHMPDGMDLVLLGDGSSQEVKR